MILVLGGTSDALEIAGKLSALTHDIIISTATAYGFEVSRERFSGEIVFGRMDRDTLKNFLHEWKIGYVVDASHPYAENISRNAISVCQELGIPYLRFERPELEQDHSGRIVCRSLEQAGELVEELLKKIPGLAFITTGINNIEKMLGKISDKSRLKVRILPQSETVRKLEDLGLNADQIIAMKGPFSEEMNYLMFKEAGAAVLVAKDSGKEGGTDHKLAAADRLGIKVILIRRPVLDYPYKFTEISALLNYFK
jgi:precorrin-6A/cobalt-precorrin-6A reductase